MGSPSPGATKFLKKENSTMMAVPHRRSPSVTSSSISLEVGDQELQSPAKSNGLGKSPVTTASSPRTPAGVPSEKSISPAAKKKRRSSIGGAEDIVRGLDFSSTASPVEEKKHPYLAKGGGLRKSATQTNSLLKKTATTPPGKEKLVGSAVSSSVLSSMKIGDASKKELISPRGSELASEGAILSGITNSNSDLGVNGGSDPVAEEVTSKKSSPRGSLDGKIKKSSPARPSLKYRPDSMLTKARASSNVDQVAGDSRGSTPGEVAKSDKSHFRSSLDGKTRKSTPSPSKPKIETTSSKGSKVKRILQETPSTQPGRVRKQAEKAVRNEEISKPEVLSVNVPLYSENECSSASKSENISDTSNIVPAPLTNSGPDEDINSSLLDGNVGDEDINSLDHPGGEPDFDNDNELHTSWLSEDLPCTFSALSHLPEPDDSSSSLLHGPPEILSEQFLEEAVGTRKTFDDSLPADQNDGTTVMPLDISASYAGNPATTLVSDPLIEDLCHREISKRIDEQQRDSESSTLHMDEYQMKDPFEAEIRPQKHDSALEHELEQASVPPPHEEYVDVPVTLLSHQSEIMKNNFMGHLEDISSSTSDNEDSFGSESVAHEASHNNVQVAENLSTVSAVGGGGNLSFLLSAGDGCHEQPISHQMIEASTSEDGQVTLEFLEGDEIFYQLNDSPIPMDMSASHARSASQKDTSEKDEVSTICSSSSIYDVESSDDESLEEIIEDAILNLKKSFDDVAEPLRGSGIEVADVCVSDPLSILTTVPVTVDAREDTFEINSNCITDSRDQAAHKEVQTLPEMTNLTQSTLVAKESLVTQVCGTLTSTDLDQDTKTKEFWNQTVTDESSKSDAGQNDAEDLQLTIMSLTELPTEGQTETDESATPIEMTVSIMPTVDNLKLTSGNSIEPETSDHSSTHLCVSKVEVMDALIEREPSGVPESLANSSYPDSTVSLPDSENYQLDIVSVEQEEASPSESTEVVHLVGMEDLRKSIVMGESLSSNWSSSQSPEYIQHQEPPNLILLHYLDEPSLEFSSIESDVRPEMVLTTSSQGTENIHVVETSQEVTSVPDEPTSTIADLSLPVTIGAKPSLCDSSSELEGSVDLVQTFEDSLVGTPLIASSNCPVEDHFNQHLDDSGSSDADSITSELSQKDSHFSSTLQDVPEENFVTAAELDSKLDIGIGEGLNPGMDDLCIVKEIEVWNDTSKTTESGDGDLEVQNDHSKELILEEVSHEKRNRPSSNDGFEEAGKGEGFHDYILIVSPQSAEEKGTQDSPVSGQLSEATKFFNQLESTSLTVPLPPCVSEEESIAEDDAVLSLFRKEESYNRVIGDVGHVEDALNLAERQGMIENSVVDHEQHRKFSQELSKVDLLDSFKQDEYSGSLSENYSVSNSVDEVSESTACLSPAAADNCDETTLTNTASLAEIGYEPISIASGPILPCLEESSNKSSHIVDELDTQDVECNVDENRPSSGVRIVNFEGMSKVAQVLEELMQVTEKRESNSFIEDEGDLVSEEPMIVNASDSVEDDENGSDEDSSGIDMEILEETTSTVSITATTIDNVTDKYCQASQESHLSSGTSSIDDCDSRQRLDPEAKKDLAPSFDAAFEEIFSDVASDTGTITDEEIIPENRTIQDVPLKVSVVSTSDILPAAIVEVGIKESKFAWKADNVEQSSSESAKEKHPFGNEIVFNSIRESPIASGRNSKWATVDDLEEQSTSSRTADEEDISSSNLEEKLVLEDEETVVHVSEDSVDSSDLADTHNTKSFWSDHVPNHSNTLSWEAKPENDEGGLNESLKVRESALLDEDDLVVYSADEPVDVVTETATVTGNHSNSSRKVDVDRNGLDESLEKNLSLHDQETIVNSSTNSLGVSAELNNATSVKETETISVFPPNVADKDGCNPHQILEEGHLLGNEDTVLDSPKKSLSVSGDDTKWLDDETQEQSQFSRKTEIDGQVEIGKLEEPALEDEKLMVCCPKSQFDATIQGTPSITNFRCTEVENDATVQFQAGEVESISEDVTEESFLEDEDTVVHRSSENTPHPGLVSAGNTEKELVSFEKPTNEESLNGSSIKECRLEVKETMENSPIEQFSVVPDLNTADESSLDFDDVKEHAPSKDVEKEEISVLVAKETMFESSIKCTQVDVANSARLNVDEAGDTMVDYAMECLQVNTLNVTILHVDKEESMGDSAMRFSQLETANASVLYADEVETTVDRAIGNSQLDTANQASLPVEKKETPIEKLCENRESLDENSKKIKIHEDDATVVKTSSVNEDNIASVVIPNGATYNCTKDVEQDFEKCMKLDCEASASHEIALEKQTEDAGRATHSSAVGTISVDEDCNAPKCSKTGGIEDSSTREIISNGEHLKENGNYYSDCLHETPSKPDIPLQVENTSTNLEPLQDAESNSQVTQEEEGKHSPETQLYPLLPFSGSQQDRLWEEQAEAYSSGGRGTPIRNEDATQSVVSRSPSPPGEPASSDDQIQPAAGPIHNGHGVVSTPNESGEDDSLHEPNGNVKGKLHTPLRSLLLEDASKCSADGDPIAAHSTAASSPSFIRRLFRVMSTPSRAGEREGMNQAKLKKSSSMWVSCLGSPQVQH